MKGGLPFYCASWFSEDAIALVDASACSLNSGKVARRLSIVPNMLLASEDIKQKQNEKPEGCVSAEYRCSHCTVCGKYLAIVH